MVWLTVLIKKEEDAWWKNSIPASEIRKAKVAELPKAYPIGYKMNVALIETQIYLDYLLKRFESLGGIISKRKITDINEVQTENNVTINCTGLGSKELANDKELYPIHGQIVKAQKQENINCIAADFPYGANKDKLAYIVPRSDCLVLGGTAMKGYNELKPDEEITKGIIERCKDIEPNLSEIKIKSVHVGLRPGRTEIRIEKEGNSLIHNYGHGGAGFTVSWGCAKTVLELVNEIK